MASAPIPRKQDVAYIARQILSALAGIPGQLAHAKKLLPHVHPLDTFETERLEVLQGVVECLDSPVVERARAARYLLEQLARS